VNAIVLDRIESESSEDSEVEPDSQHASEHPPNDLNSAVVRVDDEKIDIDVDIDLQKVKEYPVAHLKRCSNDVAMDEAINAAATLRRKLRPKATTKGYRKGLRCWANFCARL
jgi:hypothetical protein